MKQFIASVLVALPILLNAQQACEPTADLNQDGVVGISDLLNLLSAFGDTDLDFDGIYDSVDDCVGAYDECGVCNGEGIGDANCDCEGNVEDALGMCGGNCLADFDGDGTCDQFSGACNGESIIDYQGYIYDLVEIGEQCWIKQNLRATAYNSGVELLTGLSNAEWYLLEGEGAFAAYGNNESNVSDYGLLYNGWTILSDQEICPAGWHVPTDQDMIELEIMAGMEEFVIYDSGWRGSTGEGGTSGPGYVLKSSSLWNSLWFGASGNGSDELGFSWVPAGIKRDDGSYTGLGTDGRFWIYPESNNSAWVRNIPNGNDGIQRFSVEMNEYPNVGYPVRCIKD